MLLSDDQILIRDSAREFAQGEIAPRAAEMDKTAEFPTDIAVKLGELGFLGMTISEEWGGIGADNVSLALVIEEISAADGACGLLVGLQNSVVCGPINQFGSKEQKERFLRPAARGEMRGCFCLTEPQAGSDAYNLFLPVPRLILP